jgi:DNA-binding beta-propeller fold protein YncE
MKRASNSRICDPEKTVRFGLPLLVSFTIAASAAAQSQPWKSQQLPMTRMSGLLRLVDTIPIPTEGYMDRMAIDLRGQRLFICGEAAKSLLVVDLREGKVIHETKGLAEMPKKAFYLPDSNEIWLTLTNSSVVVISGSTYEVTKTIELSAYGDPNRGADNAAYDPARHLLYAGVEAFVSGNNVENGGGGAHVADKASIEVVDTREAKLLASVKLPGGDPSGMALEPSGRRMYVAMGDVIGGESHTEVIDLEKRAIVAEWPITGGPVPHAAAVDEAHHRLFVASRMIPHEGQLGGGHQHEPGRLTVMDTETGKVIQALDNVGGSDNVDFDPATGRIYVTGTTGTVAVFRETDSNRFELLGKVPTGALAKSGLWVPEQKRFYSAVPRHYVLTPPRASRDIYGDLTKELAVVESGATGKNLPILSNLIVEEAHLLVFEFVE